MTDVVITAAARTPVGSFNGTLSSLPAHELGKIAIVETLKRSKLEPGDVSEVILGQILTAAQGQNPARQAAMAAGLPKEIPAFLVNMVCGSGLRAVALGSQAIAKSSSPAAKNACRWRRMLSICAMARKWAISRSSTP